MNDKHPRELIQVNALFADLGKIVPPVEATDRPDVIACFEFERVGIELKVLHNDERGGNRGSPMRAEEEMRLRASSGMPKEASWIDTDAGRALTALISKATQRAESYDRHRYNRLWLLISAGVLWAPVSTLVFPELINEAEVNNRIGPVLLQSCFDTMYFHIVLRHTIYEWTKSTPFARIVYKPLLGGMWSSSQQG